MKLAVLIPTLAACVLAACSSMRSPRVETGPETGSDAVLESKLEMFDPRTVADAGTRRLELTLHNTSSERLEFVFTVDGLDASGRVVPFTARQWIRVALDAGASQAERLEPMPPEATSFRLRYAPAQRR